MQIGAMSAVRAHAWQSPGDALGSGGTWSVRWGEDAALARTAARMYADFLMRHVDFSSVSAWGREPVSPRRAVTRFVNLRHELVSFLELFRIARDDDTPALSLTFVSSRRSSSGVAATALVGFGLGVVIARGFAAVVG